MADSVFLITQTDKISVTDDTIDYFISLHQYSELIHHVQGIEFALPSPSKIVFEQHPPIMGASIFPDIYVHLIYEGWKLITDPDLTQLESLAKIIRDKRLTSRCSSITQFMTDGKSIFLPIWELSPSTLDWKAFGSCQSSFFWSSIVLEGRPVLDSYSTPVYKFPTAPKYTMEDQMGDSTSLLLRYQLSEASQERLAPYRLVYKFQDGRTHIWMNLDIVVKLNFHRILAQHERDILQLNIPGLPKLLDYWESEEECFLIMENGGPTLLETFVFEALYPSSVLEQKLAIQKELERRGLKHMDDHNSNYGYRKGKLTLFDAEVIIDLEDYDAFINKREHTYRFPIKYYKLISSRLF